MYIHIYTTTPHKIFKLISSSRSYLQSHFSVSFNTLEVIYNCNTQLKTKQGMCIRIYLHEENKEIKLKMRGITYTSYTVEQCQNNNVWRKGPKQRLTSPPVIENFMVLNSIISILNLIIYTAEKRGRGSLAYSMPRYNF